MSSTDIHTEVRHGWGLVTLTRPQALNALSLPMVRALYATLLAWREDPAVHAVALRGSNKRGARGSPESFFGAFCAGGDIRFFHQAALAGDPSLDAFFTEEYQLDFLLQRFPKPLVVYMDGIVMGGGMGLSQGARLRIVTEQTQMAMPETGIGLFPDVGGGYFLSRCPGNVGEYLGLSGDSIDGMRAVAWGLADVCVPAQSLATLWDRMLQCRSSADVAHWIASEMIAKEQASMRLESPFDPEILAAFGAADVGAILAALAPQEGAADLLQRLRARSPLMLHVVLAQIRRARGMDLADVLRMERDMVHHCFHLRPGAASETVEGIRALAVDKDRQPRWNPARLEDVSAQLVASFFNSPWSAQDHPLRHLQG